MWYNQGKESAVRDVPTSNGSKLVEVAHMSIIPPVYRCTKCGIEYPHTKEYFYTNKLQKDGLTSVCKSCIKQYQQDHKEATNLAQNARYAKSPEKQRQIKRSERAKRGHQINEIRRKNYAKDVERQRQMRRDNYQKYRPAILAQKKEKHRNNPEVNHLRNKDWRQRNPEKQRASVRAWIDANPEKARLISMRRRTRKHSLPNNFTHADWLYAIEYFHGCCAVCGRQANDLFGTHTLAADHWIPLASPDCPGTIPTNILPLCHGIAGCNNKKRAFKAEDWLIKSYGKRKAKSILANIYEYFDSLKAKDGR